MNKGLILFVLSTSLIFSTREALTDDKALSVRIGGCSIILNDGWELVSRDELETTFMIRDGLSFLIYSSYDPGTYSDKDIRILEETHLDNITLLRIAIDPPNWIENLGITELAYIHDAKYAFTVMGPLAESYWSMDTFKDRISNGCR